MYLILTKDFTQNKLFGIGWKLNKNVKNRAYIKFIYSEKATKFCEIFILLLTVCTAVKNKVKILQNFVAFSEYMNFNQKK